MVKIEKNGYVAVITIARPASLNALNSETLNELYAAAEELRNDKTVRCIIITGEGKAFVAGADIAEMRELDADGAKRLAMLGHRAFTAIETLPMPVIAAVNGYALGGGCELALSADIRIAGERARFAQPETGLGITPGFGGTQRLARTVGVAKAMELILTASTINAEEAMRIGLVNRVVAQDRLMGEALAMANAISANAPVAVKNAKKAIRRFTQNGMKADLEAEAEFFGECFATEDQKLAMAAFVDKTPKREFVGE